MTHLKTHIPLAQARIGVDIGRVLMCPTHAVRGPDTSFLSASPELALEIPPSPGAEATLKRLVAATSGNVWFVSKAGRRIQGLTRRWFEHNDFFARSGIPEAHLRFCFKRSQKRGIARDLGLTHFIDDRADVLAHLAGVVPYRYLFGVQHEPAPSGVCPVADWTAIAGLLLPQKQQLTSDAAS